MALTSAFYPTTASGWTNSTNVGANDGSLATNPTALFLPGSNTSILLCGGFSITGISGDDTINGFDVTIELEKTTGVASASYVAFALFRSGAMVGTGYGTAVLTAGHAVEAYNIVVGLLGGSWTVAQIADLQLAIFVVNGTAYGPEFVGIDYVTVKVDYTAATPPSAITFTDVVDVEPSSTNDSEDVAVAGPATCTMAVTATDPDDAYYMVNGDGTWIASASAHANLNVGDSVRLRIIADAAYSTARTATLTLGGVTADTFSVTTRAEDVTPTAFSFIDQTDVALSSTAISAPIIIAGIDASCSCSITGGEYSINGSAFTSAAGTVALGDSIRVSVAASASPGTGVTATFTAGGVSDAFTATTLSDTTPDAFTLGTVAGASTSTVYSSSTITVNGTNDTSDVAFSTLNGTAHEYSKNGGAWTAVGATTVDPGDTMQVRLTSPAGATEAASVTMDIGGVQDTYAVSTGADVDPDAFSFTSVTNAIAGKQYVSPTTLILSGMTPGIDVLGTVSPNGFASSLVGSYGPSPVTLRNGYYVKLWGWASSTPGATEVVSLTIGATTGTFSITTASAMPMDF